MTRKDQQRGVTLIELLVVLAILALMAGAVAFNLPPARSDAKREAERFAALVDAASTESVVAGRPMRVEMTRGGYSFSRFDRGEWAAELSTTLSPRMLAGVALDVTVEDPSMKNEQTVEPKEEEEEQVWRIVFDSIGAISPFTADFTDKRERWRVARTPDGTIEVSENAKS